SRAVIQVDEYFKRGLDQASLQVGPDCPDTAPITCLAHEASYQAGSKVVLFLQQNAAGWTTVQGKTGQYAVRDGHVFDAAGADQGELAAFEDQLAKLTGAAGIAPLADPTPEAAPQNDSGAIFPWLYVAAILVGVGGLILMAVLVRNNRPPNN